MVYLWHRQHEQALAEAERTLALDPNDPENYDLLAFVLNFVGRPAEAIGLMEKAMRLNPRHDLPTYLTTLGVAYRLTGRYEEAIATFKRILIHNPDYLFAHAGLAGIYSELGREEEARAEAAEVLRLNPDYSLEQVRQRLPYKDQAGVRT